MKRLSNYWAGLSIILILVASVAFHSIQLNETIISDPVRADARDYVNYAINLQKYGVYSRADSTQALPPAPDALRSPGYPAFVALLINPASADFGLERVLVAQVVIGVATVALSYWLFYMMMPWQYAAAAATLTSVSPHLVNSSSYFLTEGLFTFLLIAHVATLIAALRKQSFPLLLVSGLSLAASTAVRPTSQYLWLFYVAAIPLLNGVSVKRKALGLTVIALPVLLFSLAWGGRNQAAIGVFSDQTLSANFLQHGMYINMMYRDDPRTYGYPYRFDPESPSLQAKPLRVVVAILQHAWSQPGRYLGWYLIGKPIQFFSWDLTESIGGPFIYAPEKSPWLDSPVFRAVASVMAMLHTPLMWLSCFAAFMVIRFNIPRSFKQNGWVLAPVVLIPAVVCIYFIVLHMVGSPFPRYSIPLRPISYGLAMYAIWQLAMRLGLQRTMQS